MARDKNNKTINWFPGHMAKATRELHDIWKQIDATVEVADARLPLASRNPVFLKFSPVKPQILVLSHADLADPVRTAEWIRYFTKTGIPAIACDLKKHQDINRIRQSLIDIHKPLLEKAQARGRRVRPLRVLVAGVPNTGKSTLINQLAGKRSRDVASRPGVTRSLEWLRSGSELTFLDSPGILPHKIVREEDAIMLAAASSIDETIFPAEHVALKLAAYLLRHYPDKINTRYGVARDDSKTTMETFQAMAFRMGCLLSENSADTARFSLMFLSDFRSCRIGRITLESPPEINESATDTHNSQTPCIAEGERMIPNGKED